ncbi:MAG TPA: DUF4142 domain-containing protein [Polyangia bacterium]|nr:DUF4142 domain-containing protein [Polyangia bacterium]
MTTARAVFGVAFAALVGCGGGAPEETMGASAPLTDGQVAAVALGINAAEIATANIALARTQSGDVRSFARRMVDESMASSQTFQAVLAAEQIAMDDSGVAHDVADEAAARAKELWAVPAPTFDVAFADEQMLAHQKILAVVESSLLPAPTDPGVSAEMGVAALMLSAHMTASEQLRGALSASDDAQPE